MRYNIGFLSGFMEGDCTMPMRVDGFKEDLTFKRGPGFEAWISDETRVIVDDGPVGEVPMWVKNRRALHDLLDAWLDGREYEG